MLGKNLNLGDSFSGLTVNVCVGGSFNLKANLDAKYNLVLFYRGHWWPFRGKRLSGYEVNKGALVRTNGKVILAGSVDGEDKISKLQAGLNFPIGVDMTRQQGESFEAFGGSIGR